MKRCDEYQDMYIVVMCLFTISFLAMTAIKLENTSTITSKSSCLAVTQLIL